jgi:hypothetical protein
MSLNSVTSGTNNTAVGYQSGQITVSGTKNTFVGSGTTSSGDYSYSTAIGYNSQITANTQIVLGTALETVSILGSLVSQAYVEKFTLVVYNASLSVAFTASTIYYIANVTGPITSLAITSIPVQPLSSYSFSFILSTTNSSNYITASSATFNGTSVNLSGGAAISLGQPTQCILQQITLLNISNTSTPSYISITSASAF